VDRLIEAKVEAYRRGAYQLLGLFDRQMQALDLLTDSQTSQILYGGGARGGKTNLLCKWKLYTRLSYDRSVGMTVREEKTKLEDTTMKSWQAVLDEEGLVEGRDYTKDGKFTYIFKNGSVEMFRELKYQPVKDPEFDRIGSYDLTDVAIDEAQQIHWKGFNALMARLSVLTGKNRRYNEETGEVVEKEWKVTPKIYMSCNPSKGWLYQKFYKPSQTRRLEEYKAFVPSLATDNPYIEPEYVENLKKSDHATVQRLLHGNWEYDDDPASLVDYDAIMDMFENSHVKAEGPKMISADLAMQGRDRFVAGHWHGNVATVSIDMPKATGRSIELALRDLKERERVGNSRIVADADGLGAYLESYIRNIKPFHGGSSAYHRRDYANLKSECAWKLAELINKREIRVVATEDQQQEIATELTVCLKRAAIDKDTMTKRLITKEEMKDSLRRSPDYLDFLIMGMYFKVMPQAKKIPVKVTA
jgi:phage terminase large subunit